MKTANPQIVVAIALIMIFQGLIACPVSFARGMELAESAGALALPEGRGGQAYEYQLRTEGGLAPLTWRLAGGELPAGISLDASGKLSGLLGPARREAYSFVVEVSDSSQPPQRFSQPLLLMVQAAPLRILVGEPTLKILSPHQPRITPAYAPNLEPTSIREETSASSTSSPVSVANLSASSSGPAAAQPPTFSSASNPALARAGSTQPRNGKAPASRATSPANESAKGSRADDPPRPADPKPAVVCGQVSLASLNGVLAFLNSLAAADAKQLGIESNNEAENLRQDIAKRLKARDSDLFNSRLKEDCGEDTRVLGNQRLAVIKLLRDGLKMLSQVRNAKAVIGAADANVSKELIEKQIFLLQRYLGNVKVQLKATTKPTENSRTTFADKDGNFEFKGLAEDTYTLSTEADDSYTSREFNVRADDTLRVNIEIEDRPVSLLTRAVVGYQQAAAAAVKSDQNYFFDLFISKTLPVRQSINPDFGERWRTWGAFRAMSVPQSGDLTISDTVGNFVSNVGGLKAKDAARVFDAIGGIEVRIAGNTALLPSFDRQTKQKFTLSLIAGFGFVTPTNPQDEIKVFKVSKDAPGLPPEAKDKAFVAFVPSDRDRFFRQYYGGVRLQTFFFNRYNVPTQRFPGQLDFTIGKNEYVTGGQQDDPVLRLDGYFPLPYENLKFINIFGTAIFRPVRAKTSTPLILEPADSSVKPPASNIALIPVSQFNRDYYRVGIGMDFVSFVQKLMALGKK